MRTARTREPSYRKTAGCVLTAIVLACVWLAVSAVPAAAGPASVVFKGQSGAKQIALTFDDNTSVSRGVATLRALEQDDIPATLFLIGSAVGGTPAINAEIVKGMNLGLFEVGDHSWSHPVLKGLSVAALERQIGAGVDAFHAATGARTVPLFRPPYGSTNAQVAAVAGSEGFKYLVLWDVDPRDWAGGSASSIASHVIGHAHAGAIVVMHLSAAHTAAAIHTIVTTLRAKGYEFVTVSTMLRGTRLFLDVDEGSEAGQAIATMVHRGYMSGYDTNYFGPDDAITRAQVAKVATLVGGLHTPEIDAGAVSRFSDVQPALDSAGNIVAYPFDYIVEASAAGLVAGAPLADGSIAFRPNETITRVQLAQILARMAQQLKGYGSGGASAQVAIGGSGGSGAGSSFADVPGYAAADVSLVADLGLMSGYSGTEFRPWQSATRAQVAQAMSRYLALPAWSPGG